MMDHFNTGVYPLLTVWWFLFGHVSTQYQDMVCEKISGRQGRTMIRPGPECDMSLRNYCTQKTATYPEDKIMEIILDNRGIMKRLFGDSREARFLQQAHENDIMQASLNSQAPPAPKLRLKKKRKKAKANVYSRTSEGEIFTRGVQPDDEWKRKRRVISIKAYEGQSLSKTDIKASKEKEEGYRPNDRTFSTAFSVSEDILTGSDTHGNLDPVTEYTVTPESSTQEDESNTEINAEETNTVESVTKNSIVNKHVPKNASQETDLEIDKGDDHTYDAPTKSPTVPAQSVKPEDSKKEESHTATIEEMTLAWNAKVKASPEARVEFPNDLTERNRHKQKYHSTGQRISAQRPIYPRPQLRDNLPLQEKPVTTTPPPSPEPTYMIEKFQACNSTTEIIAPTWARNLQGKNLIVVNVGSFMQHLHVEECSRNSLYRKMYCRSGCRCEQQYRLQKLLVIDPDDECRGIFSDWFRFPSCCVCVCYPASWQSTQGRHGRIIEEDYEEYDYDMYEDEEYVDEDDEDPMMTSASQTKRYTSYTNPESIDRSYPGVPVRTLPKLAHGGPYFNHLNHKMDATGSQGSIKPLNNLSYLYNDKSKLLKWSNGTVNIRPQVAPRRIPPVRTKNYSVPWFRPPLKSLWPSLDYYRKFPSISSFRPNAKFASGLISPVTSSVQFGAATQKPAMEQAVTLGTISSATQPFYSWSWRVPKSLPDNLKSKKPKLRRLPRSARYEV